jgi:hypothetical protein
MKKYIEFNIDDGVIICIRNILESDTILYESDKTSLLEIDSYTEVDLRNSYISGTEIKELPNLPITYDTLIYEIGSSRTISFSTIPANTSFTLEYNGSIIEHAPQVDDNILTFTFDTEGTYKLEFDNTQYNNLSSTTYSITAL